MQIAVNPQNGFDKAAGRNRKTEDQLAQEAAASAAIAEKQAPSYEQMTKSADGLTATQAGSALGAYGTYDDRSGQTHDLWTNLATQGKYTPEEAAQLKANAIGAAQRTGNQVAQQAYNSNAGGGANPFLASARQMQTAHAVSQAGQQASADITGQQADSRVAGIQGLSGQLSTDRAAAEGKADIYSRTADQPGRDALIDASYKAGLARQKQAVDGNYAWGPMTKKG